MAAEDDKGDRVKIFFWSLIFIISSCAVYKTHNQTTTGFVNFPGGIYKEDVWDDKMIFNRVSWYHGLTLYYDSLVYAPTTDSKFAKWFSDSEKEYFNKCEKFLVSVNYSAAPFNVSHVMFREQMRLNGYDDVVINNFATYVKTHPTFQAWNLQNYKILGFCKRSPTRVGDGNKIYINFPNFREMKIAP